MLNQLQWDWPYNLGIAGITETLSLSHKRACRPGGIPHEGGGNPPMRPWAPQRWAEPARKRFTQTPIGVDLGGGDWVGGAGKSCREGRSRGRG